MIRYLEISIRVLVNEARRSNLRQDISAMRWFWDCYGHFKHMHPPINDDDNIIIMNKSEFDRLIEVKSNED